MPAIQEFMTGLTDWQNQNNTHHTVEIYTYQDLCFFFQKRIGVKIRLEI